MSTTITIGEILEMTPGDKDNPAWVNDDFEAIVKNLEAKTANTGKAYARCRLEDPHNPNIGIQATLFIPSASRLADKLCHFSGPGTKVESYNGELKLVIGKVTKINVVGTAKPSTPAPVQPQAQDPRQPTPAAAVTVPGPTVGMAINQAIGILKDAIPCTIKYFESPEFSRDLHALASDIIRVAQLLEKGKLAAPVLVRDKARPPAAPKPTPPPPPTPAQPDMSQPASGDDEIPF